MTEYKASIIKNIVFQNLIDVLVMIIFIQLWQSMQNRGEFLLPGGITEKEWAKHSYVQLNTLQEVHKLVEELTDRLKKLKITVQSHQNTSRKDQTLIIKVGVFYVCVTIFPSVYFYVYISSAVVKMPHCKPGTGNVLIIRPCRYLL